MTEIYSDKDIQNAAAALKKSLAVYIFSAAAVIAVCVLFVLLYTWVKYLLWLCVAVNFILTVLLFWITVLYFSEVFSKHNGRLRLFRVMENAAYKIVCATFISSGGTKTIDRAEYAEYAFEADGERTLLYVLSGARCDFKVGTKYNLRLLGERIVAYGEGVENA